MAKYTMEESIYNDADEIGKKCAAIRALGVTGAVEVLVNEIQDHSCEIQTALERKDG